MAQQTFSWSVDKSAAFHPHFVYNLTTQERDDCTVTIEQKLESSAFFDPYQLHKDLNGELWELENSDVDLEVPVTSDSASDNMLRIQRLSGQAIIRVPFHMRYQPVHVYNNNNNNNKQTYDPYVRVHLQQPLVSMVCVDKAVHIPPLKVVALGETFVDVPRLFLNEANASLIQTLSLLVPAVSVVYLIYLIIIIISPTWHKTTTKEE
ncbi:hypothetical protein MIR68_009201 [Amoeboaphelidium protococcarum]|nr:hypothetical protein MIR68_009201 [Amoeboaphelidium protococcarum]